MCNIGQCNGQPEEDISSACCEWTCDMPSKHVDPHFSQRLRGKFKF